MDTAALKKSTVTVIGAARSGRAVARLLAEAGANVFLSDVSEKHATLAGELTEIGIESEFGGHTDRVLTADFLVVSPGVPSNVPILEEARSLGLTIYSEIEVASWFWDKPMIATTGTNGKTTTTSLLGHAFTTAGWEPLVAGNIGKAFSESAAHADDYDVAVLEVSSFQLDNIDRFRPDVSILLNISPDHLDRYDDSFEKYRASKYRIFENQTKDDTLVYNIDDEHCGAGARLAEKRSGVAVRGFSQKQQANDGAFVRDDALYLNIDDEEKLMQIDELALRGKHNTDNALAAAIAARVMEVPLDDIRRSLSTFEGVPHRLETVRRLDGVSYVNDSKATNVNAVWYALESYREPVVLIAGGRDKGNDYSQIAPLVREKARAVIALGESADKVYSELGSAAPHAEIVDSLEEAVQRSRALAQPGDVVLLSPACSSFDMFNDFEDRGDTFRSIVNNLK